MTENATAGAATVGNATAGAATATSERGTAAEITFAGAANEVTGSLVILRVAGRTILLDCGMYQGRRKEAREKNATFPIPATSVDAVLVSHAHIDHIGRLPLLAKEGFAGTIWATAATRDLAAVMLTDSAYIQESDARFLAKRQKEAVPPLYTQRDAARVAELMTGVPYNKTFDVVPGVRATFVEAGHILGSASIVLDCTEGGTTRRLVYSGDIGQWGMPIIRDPAPPGGANVVIMESTYGNRTHGGVDSTRDALASAVNDTARRGGRVLIPAFALGRTQEIVYELHQLRREGKIPEIPIYIDSPLATNATTVFAMHPEVYDTGEDLVGKVRKLFDFPMVRYTQSVEESKSLNTMTGPLIIIAASGMAENGRILHHLANGASDPRNTILIVGYQAANTLGRRIVERAPTLRIFGEEVPLRAEVRVLNGYSAHADRNGLVRWIGEVRAQSPALERVYLVHGEPDSQAALVSTLEEGGYRAAAPAPGTRVPL